MKPRTLRAAWWLIGSGWFTFILFCLTVTLVHHLIFAPADIQGRSDYRKFPIAVQGESAAKEIAFCTFEAGPPREFDPASTCGMVDGAGAVTGGSLLMKLPSGLVPMVKDEPDYGWTQYTILSAGGNVQTIETERYYNSDSLITRYRVTGTHVEPVAQIFATRGLNQMFAFSLPILLLVARLLASLLRSLAKKLVASTKFSTPPG